MRVFVTGGTGLVGGRLVPRLIERGHQVFVLTRRPVAARLKLGERCKIVEGDATQRGEWMDAVAQTDGVIHLAGEGIFDHRWNEEIKQSLVASRVKGTEHVIAAMLGQAGSNGRPRTLISASAVGYYGPHGDEELTEESPPGDYFLAHLCVDWEKTARGATSHGIRLVIVRIGVVFDTAGSALQKMLTPFKLFVGGPIGSGKQYLSWVHIEDLVSLFLFALENPQADGVYNATAPQPVTNKEFSQAAGALLHRPSFLPTPKFALRIALGEVADVITEGQRVLPKHALAQGFAFRFPDLGAALQDLLVTSIPSPAPQEQT